MVNNNSIICPRLEKVGNSKVDTAGLDGGIGILDTVEHALVIAETNTEKVVDIQGHAAADGKVQALGLYAKVVVVHVNTDSTANIGLIADTKNDGWAEIRNEFESVGDIKRIADVDRDSYV